MTKNRLFFFVVFFLSFFNGLAQEERKEITLKIILSQISKQHNVQFNYIEDEIVLFKLIPPENKWKLQEKLDYIKKETKLLFKIISNKYITVYNDKKLDKPLCGYLFDSETNVPIENVSITILNNNVSTFSNSNGYFELPKVSSNTIEIKHMSYEVLEINPIDLYTTNCPNFKLIPITQVLNELKIQRYLTTGITKKNNGSLVVKTNKFGILPGLIEPDILQIAQQVPGINTVDETISNINVRGGTHDQNLFLWNGIRLFQTGHFFGLISAFNPLIVETISITKNGSSAFFGESVSSVFEINSNNTSNDNASTIVSSNFIDASIFKNIKFSKKSNLKISVRRSLTDFFDSPAYKSYSDRIFQNTVITDLNSNEIQGFKNDKLFYFYDVNAHFNQKIGLKNELKINIIAIENTIEINQSIKTQNKKSKLEQENYGASINWKTNWNQSFNTEINTYFSNYDLNSLNQSVETNQILEQKNIVLDFGFRLKNSHKVSKTYTFNNGYQFNDISVTNFDEINLPFFSRKVKEALQSHVLIVEGIFETENKATLINTGLRINYFDKFQAFLIEPRIQFNQSITKQLRLEILGELKSQTLSQIIDLQQDFLGIEKRRWTIVNDETIPIQKSKQISLGFSFKNSNWYITLDNYFKKVSGITTSSQGFQNQFEFVKTTGDYQVFGSEILVQKSFNKFYTWLSYSYNKNKYTFDSLTPHSFSNNFELIHNISWASIYEWNTLKFALGCKWHTGKLITTPTSFTVSEINPNIVYNSPNNSRLNDYFQINFSTSKNWKLNQKITLQTTMSILNVLNTTNRINRFYRVNTENNKVESVDTYSLERTPNINVKLSF